MSPETYSNSTESPWTIIAPRAAATIIVKKTTTHTYRFAHDAGILTVSALPEKNIQKQHSQQGKLHTLSDIDISANKVNVNIEMRRHIHQQTYTAGQGE